MHNLGRIEAGIIAGLVATGMVLYGLVAIFALWLRDVRQQKTEPRKDERDDDDPGTNPTDRRR